MTSGISHNDVGVYPTQLYTRPVMHAHFICDRKNSNALLLGPKYRNSIQQLINKFLSTK